MDPLVVDIFDKLKERGWMIATAESCTGGLISWALTDVAGSSAFVDRGFVTYSNEAKTDMLGVPADLIANHGAVSAEVARAMALGALKNSRADISVSVTGIAGPGGGTPDKPVGLVFIAVGLREETRVYEHRFEGDRSEIRLQSMANALAHVYEVLTS